MEVQMPKKTDAYGLDPDKFENDFPHRPDPPDDEIFESIYQGGLSLRDDSRPTCAELGTLD